MKFKIDLIKESPLWEETKNINSDLITNIFREVLNEIKKLNHVKDFEISILLSDDRRLNELNKEFLKKDKPTNILSFPDIEIYDEDFQNIPEEFYLGDLAISYERVDEESKNYMISFENHFTHLVVHGILHLLGYDHEEDNEWHKMSIMEINILNKLNIDKPPIYV